MVKGATAMPKRRLGLHIEGGRGREPGSPTHPSVFRSFYMLLIGR